MRGAREHAIAGTLVEWLFERHDFAPNPLVEGIQLKIAQPVVEAVAAAHLRGPFVVNAGEDLSAVGGVRVAAGQEDRSYQAWFKPIVAVSVDALMKLVGCERGEWTVLVGQSSAIGGAVGPIRATIAAEEARHRDARVGEVASAAARGRPITLKIIAIGKVAVVLGVVLAWRDQRAELEAVEDRRLIPNRVGHAPIKLGAVITAGIAHDRIVIAESSGERIHGGRGFLVRRAGFTRLDRPPVPL